MRALVLRKTPFGESDLIVQLLMQDGSLRSGFAAGARRSKKRFPHQFNPAGIYELEWTHRDSAPQAEPATKLSRIHSCELVKFHFHLSEDLEALSRWSTILEWIAIDGAGVFSFLELVGILEALETSPQSTGLQLYFSFFLGQISSHGISPELQLCVACGKNLETACELFPFSLSGGGVMHPQCGTSDLIISKESLEIFKASIAGQIERFEKGKSPKEWDDLLIPYLEIQLGHSLRSQKFFRQL